MTPPASIPYDARPNDLIHLLRIATVIYTVTIVLCIA